jgi:hypothetical protein
MIVYSFILFHEDPMFFWPIIIFKQVKESCFVLAFKQNCIPQVVSSIVAVAPALHIASIPSTIISLVHIMSDDCSLTTFRLRTVELDTL